MAALLARFTRFLMAQQGRSLRAHDPEGLNFGAQSRARCPTRSFPLCGKTNKFKILERLLLHKPRPKDASIKGNAAQSPEYILLVIYIPD